MKLIEPWKIAKQSNLFPWIYYITNNMHTFNKYDYIYDFDNYHVHDHCIFQIHKNCIWGAYCKFNENIILLNAHNTTDCTKWIHDLNIGKFEV